MKKIVNINGNEYTIQSSAYTLFAYKDLTGREMLEDIQKLSDSQELSTGKLTLIGDLIYVLLDLLYVMYREATPNGKEKKDLLKELDGIFDDPSWANDVMECAVSPLSRQLQTSKPTRK